MRVVQYERVTATSPGKHGDLDWRVEFCNRAATHGELTFQLGMHLVAEDRYNGNGHRGRYLFWHFVQQLLYAQDPEQVIEIAKSCAATKDGPIPRVTIPDLNQTTIFSEYGQP